MTTSDCPECGYPVKDGCCPICADKAAEARARDAKARDREAASLGGLRALETYTLERFKPSDRTREAFQAAGAFDRGSDSLYLHGPVGCGKTHLAVAAARKYAGKVSLLRPPALSLRIRAAQDAHQEAEIMRGVASVPVLILDDIGAEKHTEFMVSLLHELIDWRYQNQPTGLIVTSNLSLGELARKIGDERITSRLVQMARVFNLSGEEDHRLRERPRKTEAVK